MPEPLSQVVVQSFVAALVVEALLRTWDVRSPELRLRCRVGSLALPLVLLPVFEVLAPFRHAEWFRDGPALFATAHLRAFTVEGVGVDRLWPWPVALLGAVLLARDLWPLITARSIARRAGPAPVPPALSAAAAMAARFAGVPLPRILMVATPVPLLLCAGVRAPRLLVSPALVELLDEGELVAALTHELSHLRHRDVLWSWLLLGLRVLQAFNPVAQVLGRVAARETELRADAEAARWSGRPLALASALLRVAGPGHGLVSLGGQAGALELEDRVRRLLEFSQEKPPAPGWGHFAGATLGLITLLFFIT